MFAHIDIEVIEVLYRASKLFKTFDCARLVPLVQNLKDLFDQLQCRFDSSEFNHVFRQFPQIGEQLGDNGNQLL